MYYALRLSYHSNTEAVLVTCLSSGWAATTGRLLGPKVGNGIKCLSQGHSDALPHRKSNQGFATFQLLARRSRNLMHLSLFLFFVEVTSILKLLPNIERGKNRSQFYGNKLPATGRYQMSKFLKLHRTQ